MEDKFLEWITKEIEDVFDSNKCGPTQWLEDRYYLLKYVKAQYEKLNSK